MIVSRILQSHSLDGQGSWPPGAGWPKLKVVSLYVDQKHEKDIGDRLAAEHGVPIVPSIEQALTLGGNLRCETPLGTGALFILTLPNP